MDGGRDPVRPRRVSAAAELGANSLLQDGEVMEVDLGRESHCAPDKPSGAGGRMEKRHSMPQVVHQRHMPREPLKFHIPRKTKEQRALFQNISAESREYEDMLTILTSSYIDAGSAGSFIYSNPRLVHSEQLEKEFVDKRREMKADGRTDKELEEGYGFLMADSQKLQPLCEKGLSVSHSWVTALGDPAKGVYLSRYSDLLQVNLFTPGASGDIIIFKVMKGKVKSIYENMKNLLDPTPRFDSHLSKNTSKVTALTSYRAFELTQQYYYEYFFDEPQQRPRQICPYAVISFHFKGKDSVLPSKPLAPIRSNSQSAEGSKDLFTVWNGDLVKGERLLFQVCLRSSSPPFIPHKLPEKLDISWLMRFDHVTRLLPPALFSYNLYSTRHEVVEDGHYCSLLEVVDRSRSMTSITRLLNELERKRVVLVIPLMERGVLFLLSSVQMAPPTERGEGWRRSLQALFVSPQSRKVKPTLQSSSSVDDGSSVMPWLKQFIPPLHQALVKARANPPPDLSAFVEHQTAEYLNGLNDGKVRAYLMGEYDTNADEQGQQAPVPKHHQLNMNNYLQSYLYSPNHYLLSRARVRQVVEASCGPEELKDQNQNQDQRTTKTLGGQRKATGEETSIRADRRTNQQKRNAENELRRETEGEGVARIAGGKRRMEQEATERAAKFLRASQEPGGSNDVRGSADAPSSPGSLTSVIGSVGLKDVDLRDDGSKFASEILSLLTGLKQTTKGTANQGACEVQDEGQRESCPFDRLATKLGLPTSCDLDLRKQDDLEEQTAGSISSLEGFSPSSHSGELNHHRAAGRGGGGQVSGLNRSTGAYEEEESEMEIPWVLIPITGVCSERYTHRERKLPQDPRFHHLTTATRTSPTNDSPTPSPEPSLPPSPSQCPSPEPSPPPSPSQCPSPDPSPPPSPSQCPSPDPSPPPSPSQCPSPEPSSTLSHTARLSPPPSTFNSLHHGTNEEQPASPGLRGGPGASTQQEEPCLLSTHPTPEEKRSHSPPPPVRGGVKEEGEELPVSSCLSPPVCSPPTRPQGIDNIVDKHLGDFSFDIQLLLQEESVQYSFPQAPLPATPTDTPSSQHILPHTPMAAFSHYVSFHHPCPPVQGYVSSLQNNISNMLTQFEEHRPPLRNNVVDAALASSVSAFVASIRAANDDQNGTAADEPAPSNPPSTPHQVAVSDPNVASVCNEPLQQCRSPQQHHHGSESSKTVSCTIRQTGDESSSDGAAAVEAAAFSGEQAGSDSGSAPPTTALSSLISQLQPEVFTSLEEIINDVRKNSLQFYMHSTEEQDPMDTDVKEYLLKRGNVEQSPAAFLNQDNSTNRLLVVIKNKDIARHVHQIPRLVSLKRHHSVVFVGIDKLDDIRNNSYNELFVSGGCIISDELVLNPDFISHDQLMSLLKAVEQQSSPESVWRWKVHCKTHKKLKEQARFRRDAASLLDVLLAYQKRQIVEFLPYHRCDMMTHQSPDLDCLSELQARYTQYRHTVFLTERRIDFSQWGIIVANVDELQHNFSRLISYHDDKDRQPITDDLQEAKGQLPPPPSSDLPQGLPPWSGPALPHASHLLDQLVPESTPAASSSKDGLLLHSDSDMEFLHQAISQLRAQRQAQKQLIQSQVLELDAQPLTSQNNGGLLEKRAFACTPPSGLRGTPMVKKAVAATLEMIHSALQPEPEPEPELEIKEDKKTTVSPSVRPPSPLSNHKPAALTQACDSNSANERRDGRDPPDQTTACSSSSSSPAGGDRGRASESHQSDGTSATLTGSVTMVTDQEGSPASALPRLHPQHQPRHPLRGSGVMHPPHLPVIRNYPFPHRAILGGMRGPQGPVAPNWPGPLEYATLDWTLPSRYHPPAGPGSTYRGQSRGGFNGM